MSTRVPGEGRYAHAEREQRWVLGLRPADADDPVPIVDRYLIGTRLRLRRIGAGDSTGYKLAQKVRPDPDSPELVKLTNLYLSAQEHAVLAGLDGAELRKTRWRVDLAGRSIAVDQFEGPLAGLLLAEVELDRDEPRLPTPPFALIEVTDDDRFSGGALAHATPADVRALLDEIAALQSG